MKIILYNMKIILYNMKIALTFDVCLLIYCHNVIK